MPTRRARFKRRYVGLRPWTRHSIVLMVAGLVYVSYGLSLINEPVAPTRDIAIQLALEYFPIQFWGGVWIATGMMSVISSRWPPVVETWGYMALTGLSAGWSATYLLGMIFGNAPDTSWSGALVWGLVAFLWWAISGLLNPDRTGVKTDG